MRRHIQMLVVLSILSLPALSLPAADLPRQFRVWGRKAPAKLGVVNARPNTYGLASISIPKDLKRIQPDTNLQDPALPAEQQSLAFLPFPTHPMRFIYPETRPFPEEIARPVRTYATPGEYATLAFAIRSQQDLSCVQIDLSSLNNPQGEV
ncbi:MAG: hypothetical protein GX564_11970, partial [Oligosphaeraceae bacterium]|nr:hypothetical protein [Oligosphaeraceae bacterium]